MIGHRLYRRFSKGAATSMVLMYHRITETDVDPWNLCVAPYIFRKQLQVISERYHVLPLEVLLRNWQQGQLQINSIALTFDDGYMDNFTDAIPLLETMKIPATFFITNARSHYWWDILEAILFQSDFILPTFSTTINGKPFYFDIKGEEILSLEIKRSLQAWKAEKGPINKRTDLYLQLLNVFRQVPQNEQSFILNELQKMTRQPLHLPALMGDEEIKRISASPLFSIGAHTANHSNLPSLSIDDQKQEILQNKQTLESLTGKSLTTLAYPYGAYTKQSISLVKDLGFSAALTTKHYSLRYAPNSYEIGRFNVPNRPDLWF